MLTGRAEPELGGSEDRVDVIGLNFYPQNQSYFQGPTIPMGHHEYRALSEMLVEVAGATESPCSSPRQALKDQAGRHGSIMFAMRSVTQ